MLPLRWSAKARERLDAIDAFIAARNPRAAERLVGPIIEAAEALPRHPYLYRPGRLANTRGAVAHPHHIIYRVELTCVRVLAAIHARQRDP